ncbi:MAG: MotA/TolQ/ExbB proton channel family protein [Actinomycetota bacterium]|nr:MotA/TolQ/ExbB proton channel family protein [Actinomycetota bacterium]
MKDTWTSVAIGGALMCVLVAMVLDGSSPAVLVKPAPLLLVFGGTFFAATAGYMKSDLKGIKPKLMRATKGDAYDMEVAIQEMSRLAGIAKSSGIIALDKETHSIEDPFLRRGIELAVDGTNSEEILDVLENDIAATEARHRMGAKVFADMGGFAPTLGIIGTVMGLVHVLGNLSDPQSLGPAIGSAFTATLWGVLSANLIWLPISNKLKRSSDLEVQIKRMEIEGLLAIQNGASSRFVRTRMESFLAPEARNRPDEKGAAA